MIQNHNQVAIFVNHLKDIFWYFLLGRDLLATKQQLEGIYRYIHAKLIQRLSNSDLVKHIWNLICLLNEWPNLLTGKIASVKLEFAVSKNDIVIIENLSNNI